MLNVKQTLKWPVSATYSNVRYADTADMHNTRPGVTFTRGADISGKSYRKLNIHNGLYSDQTVADDKLVSWVRKRRGHVTEVFRCAKIP